MKPGLPTTAAHFGRAVAVNGDTIVVGAETSSIAGPNSGAVHVYTRSGISWIEQLLSIAGPTAGNYLGHAVAIDGDTLIASALGHSGTAYVFVRSGGAWVEQQELAPIGPHPEDFGSSVDISGDTVVVGARSDDAQGVNSGSAYVFTRSGATWSQQAQLLASDATDHRRFGTSVAVDGDWAIVGAPSDYSGVAAQVYAFARSGGVWSEQQILSTLGGHDWFGYSLALDRDTALISAPLANIYRGRVDAYTRSGSTWTFQQSFAPTNVQIQDWFGTYAPGLVGDVVVISSSGSDVLGTDSGAAYVFARSGSTWSQVRELRGSQTNAYDEIGPTAFDGRTIVIGAPGAVQAGFGEVGEAYAFELTPGIDTYCTGKPNSMGCIPFVNACGGPSASSNSGFVITCFKVLDGKNGLMFYGYAPNSAPFQGGTLCVQPPTRRTPVQLAQNVVSNGSCRSVFTLDFNAWIASGVDPLLVPGANVYAQWWMRDPASASTTGLSNGVSFTVGS